MCLYLPFFYLLINISVDYKQALFHIINIYGEFINCLSVLASHIHITEAIVGYAPYEADDNITHHRTCPVLKSSKVSVNSDLSAA